MIHIIDRIVLVLDLLQTYLLNSELYTVSTRVPDGNNNYDYDKLTRAYVVNESDKDKNVFAYKQLRMDDACIVFMSDGGLTVGFCGQNCNVFFK